MSHVLQQRTITVVAGVSQTGKSTLGIKYALNAPIDYKFIFDPGLASMSYSVRLTMSAATDEYEMALGLCRGWVLFNPHIHFSGRMADAFNYFCGWTFAKCQRLPGRKLIMVDEAWRYVTGRRYPQELADCVQTGGHYGLECLFATQLPHQLHEAIHNEMSELICFQLNGDDSLKWVTDQGLDADEVKRLEKFQFVAKNVEGGGELRGRIKV